MVLLLLQGMQIIVYAVRNTGTNRVPRSVYHVLIVIIIRTNLEDWILILIIIHLLLQGRDYSGYCRLVPVNVVVSTSGGMAYATYMIRDRDTKQLRTSQELRKKEFVVR